MQQVRPSSRRRGARALGRRERENAARSGARGHRAKQRAFFVTLSLLSDACLGARLRDEETRGPCARRLNLRRSSALVSARLERECSCTSTACATETARSGEKERESECGRCRRRLEQEQDEQARCDARRFRWLSLAVALAELSTRMLQLRERAKSYKAEGKGYEAAPPLTPRAHEPPSARARAAGTRAR